ncbi:MAG TPA: GNAT family N-acetyltransferase [Thermoanaerobaculia bacterium]|nr:GNAT family N-acetyltransferase [Thermoanaerobaculia bacterium]
MSEEPETAAPIVHDPAAHRFALNLPGGPAFLKYHLDRDGRLSLDHTEVPEEGRHRGIAGRLAKAALDFARGHRLEVVPRCPFVRAYLEDHPEERDLVANRIE